MTGSATLEPIVLRLRLERDENGYPPYDSEQVLAAKIGEAVYRVLTVPVFTFGLAANDLVRVEPDHQAQPWIVEVVEEGGHSAVRIVVFGDTDPERPKAVMESLGCKVEETRIQGLIAVDVPPTADFARVEQELRKGREAKLWDYSIGVVAADHEAGGRNSVDGS